MRDNGVKLSDILDLDHLQRLQDTFADITKVSVVIVDPDGRHVTKPSNWNGFCGMFNASEVGGNDCRSSIARMLEHTKETGGAWIEECPHTGLHTASLPIVLDGTFWGSWIFGQMRMAEPDRSLLEQAGKKLNLSAEAVEGMLDELPLMSLKDFRQIFDFLQALNQVILDLAKSNILSGHTAKELRGICAQMDGHNRMLRKFIDSSDVGLYICDFYTGEILFVNDHYCRQAGLPREKIVGSKCWEINGLSQDSFCPFCPRDELLDDENKPAPPHSWTYYNQKFGQWLRCTNQAIKWADDRMVHMVTQLDITEEHEMKERLAQVAFYDRYTRLPNSEKLARDLKDLAPSIKDDPFLICFHISSMQNFNNVYGRETGHELLKTIASWIGRSDGIGGTLYCTEGYGFCLLLSDSNEEEARLKTREIRERFEEPWLLNVHGQEISYFCTLTISLICFNENIGQLDILNLIDRTLLLSQQNKDLLIYDEKMDRETKEQIRFEVDFKNSVKTSMEGFEVHYQPIVDLGTGTWKGLEALCRWTCPERGAVSPGLFIPRAEKLGLISVIGEWVLETAVSHCKNCKLDEQEGFFLSVNISSIQIMADDFADRVIEMLQQYDFPGEKLNLEITESSEIVFNSFTTSVIDKLRNYGIKMALDDFGTGYSSFSNLKNLPVNFLKTEQSFIKGIEQDAYSQYFYYIMSEIAHASGMTLIAEGIETREQLEIIKSNGADYIQGYYFSKPLTASDLENSLDKFTLPDRSLPLEQAQLPSVYSLDRARTRATPKHHEYSADSDVLTGTLNRNASLNRLKTMLQSAAKEGERLSLVVADVDGLKYINDNRGHKAGDKLLCDTVKAIRSCVRSGDVVGRIGSDEFIIIFPGCKKNLASAHMLKARARFSKSVPPSFHSLVPSFGYGVVENTELPFEESDAYVDELLYLADQRMQDFKSCMMPRESPAAC